MITHERVREALAYDPEAGVFTWLIQPNNFVKVGAVAGTPTDLGRCRIGLDGHQLLAHQLAWFWVTGEWPERDIDHIDGDPLNNRWENLRLSTRSQNNWNVVTPNRNNTSGFRGVSAQDAGWVAKIKVNGKQQYLGYFDTPEEASAAYWAAKAELHGTPTYEVRLDKEMV